MRASKLRLLILLLAIPALFAQNPAEIPGQYHNTVLGFSISTPQYEAPKGSGANIAMFWFPAAQGFAANVNVQLHGNLDFETFVANSARQFTQIGVEAETRDYEIGSHRA